MNRKHVSWLLAITVLVALVILFLPGQAPNQQEDGDTALLPGLSDRINDVARVEVIGSGGATIATLNRGEQNWKVVEADDYLADWDRLKALLSSLAQANIKEPKTSNPDYFDRLGVEDVESENSGSILVRITTMRPDESAGTDPVVGIIIGSTAGEREGHYVRHEGGERALLIDQSLDVASMQEDWLARQVIDIADSEVVGVTVRHSDGEKFVISKASADDTDFILEDLPEGRELKSAWTVNSIAGALSDVQLDKVVRDEGLDWSEASIYQLITADGVRVEANMITQREDPGAGLKSEPEGVTEPVSEAPPESQSDQADVEVTHWIRLRADVYPAASFAVEDSDDEQAAMIAEAGAETQDRVASINQRVQGWAYVIPEYKFDVMTRRLEDLIKPMEDDS